MAHFDDTLSALWKAFDQAAPQPSGGAATLTVDNVDIRLTDHHKHLRARATVCPVADHATNRSAQLRSALQYAFASLKSAPLLICIRSIQGRPYLLAEQSIDYRNSGIASVEKKISKLIRTCQIIRIQPDTYPLKSIDDTNNSYIGGESMDNDIIFRL